MKIAVFVSAFLFFLPFFSSAQDTKIPYGKYWIELSDKDESTYCLCRPQEFLSARSLQRREREAVQLTEEDLPVSESYIQQIADKGVEIHGASKWLNAVAIRADSDAIAPLYALPFVKNITYIGRHGKIRNAPNPALRTRLGLDTTPVATWGNKIEGYTSYQNEILGIPYMHRLGYRGNGIMVAVMDGGFNQTDVLTFFDSSAVAHKLIQGRDFVEGDDFVYEDAMHGTSVLSVMAGNLPGYFMGGAPEATYVLLKTEDTGSEYPIEEVNWVLGAEFADSIGADLLNASLGYTSFWDKKLTHTYDELDGASGIASRGARIGAQRGMIICNSAGNSGNDAWHYIGIPADAPGLIAVGAVQYNGTKAGFSSFGPTADGRIKPDLSAPGQEVITAGNKGADIGVSSGTSLASPMLTGAIAALWSSNPKRTSREILEAVFRSSTQYTQPDTALGWGVPYMLKAYLDLEDYFVNENLESKYLGYATYDSYAGYARLFFPTSLYNETPLLRLKNSLGQEVPFGDVHVKGHYFSEVEISGLNQAAKGLYHGLFQLKENQFVWLPIRVW